MATQIESWDDDGDFQGDLFSQTASQSRTAYSTTSFSSRVSVHSESNFGDEDWQLPLSPNDQKSTNDAILSAKQAGVPIPPNVPASALLGGSIKRLGKKNSRQKVDDWDNDLELPTPHSGGLKLKVRPSQEALAPSTPAEDHDDFEWAEGSLGVRFGGTKRDQRARSSSVSAMSPSMGSCMTMESEEDGLDGLVLPSGDFDLAARLTKRQSTDSEMPDALSRPSSRQSIAQPIPERPAATEQSFSHRLLQASADDGDDDDFLEGLEVGSSGLLDSSKQKINRNLQVQSSKVALASTRTSTTLTFTDKPGASRIPRPSGGPAKPSRRDAFKKLDPVYETGPPLSSRKEKPAATTTTAQLLRAKRSAPVLRNNYHNTSKPPSVPQQPRHLSSRSSQGHLRRDSDPSRAQSPTPRTHSRTGFSRQPETPSRSGMRRQANAAAAAQKNKDAFVKGQLNHRKRNFGDGSELDVFDDLPTSATKESKFVKAPTLRKVASAKGTVMGSITSLQQPSHAQTQRLQHKPSSIRTTIPDRMVTPLPPSTPRSTTTTQSRMDQTPRFAQDTFATRMARQQRLADMPSSATGPNRSRASGPLMPVSTNWKAQVAARSPQASPTALKRRKGTGQQPTLIRNTHYAMPRNENGMVYNAALQRWEGNEGALSRFTTPTPTASAPHLPLQHVQAHRQPIRQSSNQNLRNYHNHTSSTPNLRRPSTTTLNAGSPTRATPALISNMGIPGGKGRGVHVERGMVFDPQRMCWLKLGGAKRRKESRDLSATMSIDGDSILDALTVDEDMSDEEDDPFKGFEDLKDDFAPPSRPQTAVRHLPSPAIADGQIRRAGQSSTPTTPSAAAPSQSVAFDEPPPVCEEFDLGPEFIRRQREEETIWARRVGPWIMDTGAADGQAVAALGEEWKWAIRDISREIGGISR